MDAAVELRNVTYRYPDTPQPALSNLSLKIKKGEFVLVKGHSGSGKSTLLRCITGLVPHYTGGFFKGSVTVYGMNTLDNPVEEIAKTTGILFQDPENQMVCTMVENELAFGLENLRLPRTEMKIRVSETARELGIEHLLGRKTTELSSGEKQKTTLAALLAMEPKMLLLDEPSSQLDPASARNLNQTLFELNREKHTTIVLVEHDLRSSNMADRVIDLGAGHKTPKPAVSKPTRKTGRDMIKISNLKCRYGSRTVLKNVNLTLKEGEFAVVTGPNGSGKTTLLKHLNGLLRPSEGTVLVDGADTKKTQVEQLAKTVGFLPQNPNDYLFCDTVEDELCFTLKNLGVDGNVGETLASLGLEEYRDRYPRDLSGGERQRVALASVLVYKPKVLVLDEPTRGIDPHSRSRLLEALYRLSNRGATVIVATHDMDLARNAERTIEINNGTAATRNPAKHRKK